PLYHVPYSPVRIDSFLRLSRASSYGPPNGNPYDGWPNTGFTPGWASHFTLCVIGCNAKRTHLSILTGARIASVLRLPVSEGGPRAPDPRRKRAVRQQAHRPYSGQAGAAIPLNRTVAPRLALST